MSGLPFNGLVFITIRSRPMPPVRAIAPAEDIAELLEADLAVAVRIHACCQVKEFALSQG
jgi:hypothetical protein